MTCATVQSASGPPRKQPRPYQLDCLERIKNENSIVCIPSGAGKTLVAVLAIDHFLSPRHSHLETPKALFIVPTCVLVEQQAKYCREHCVNALRVMELSGVEFDRWGGVDWRRCIAEHDVFVGTPEIFRRAFVDMGTISPAQFALIVFDECHNATGNSPMAAICRDALWPAARAQPAIGGSRILGLTASFVNGALRNMELKRGQLEARNPAS
jgi:endoribonuclease Dicer